MVDIAFTGLGSGLAVNEIVSALVNAERVPYQARLQQKGASITANISANGALKGVLSNLSTSLEKLKDVDNYQLRKASGNDEYLTISSDKTAQVGSYDIVVNNLAKAQKDITTNSFTTSETIGEGELIFATAQNIIDGKTAFSLDIDDNDTLSDIRDKINNADNNDVISATIITQDDDTELLVLTSKKTGLDNAVTITGSEVDTNSRLNELFTTDLKSPKLQNALNASITIDGTITVSSDTNIFDDAIDGVTLTVQKAHDSEESSQISFSEDNSLISKELSKFVKSYNEFSKTVKELGRSSGDGPSGPLASDSLLRGVSFKVRSILSESFSDGVNGMLSLTELGVETDRSGTLNLDTTILNNLLNDTPEKIQNFFIGSDSNSGFANTLDDLIKNYTESNGLIDNRIDGYQQSLDRIDDDLNFFERRMEQYEDRLLKKYNAMDSIVASLNSTSGFLLAQLDNLPGVIRKSDK